MCGGRGFVHVANGTKEMSAGSIASYLSKYIGKSINKPAECEQAAFSMDEHVAKKKAADAREKAGEKRYPADPDANKKSYWISQNIAPPVRTVKLFRTFSEALSWLIDYYTSKGASWGFDKWRCWHDPTLGVLWLPAG